MDSLSIASGALGVIQLVHQTQQILHRLEGRIRGKWPQRAEAQQWEKELNETSTLLFEVRDILEREEIIQNRSSVLPHLTSRLTGLFETLKIVEAAQTSELRASFRKLKESQLRDHCQAIATYLKTVELELQLALLPAETNRAPVEAHLPSAVDLAQDESLEQVLDWLGPYDPYARQSELLSKLIPGTGSWLLGGDEFREWRKHPERTMWVCGPAGVGKTSLCSIVIDYLARQFPAPNYALGYIFLDFSNQEAMKPFNIVATLLKQLMLRSDHLQAVLTQRYHLSKQQGTRPEFEELLSILVSELNCFERAWIILDALDEYTDGIEGFVANFESLLHNSHANVFVTSRPIRHSEEHFPRIIKLDISIRAVNEDLCYYIFDRLEKGHATKAMMKDPQLRLRITEQLLQKSNGLFIAAQLLVEPIVFARSQRRVRDLLESYGNISESLDSLYDAIMARLFRQNAAQVRLALETLVWLCFACRPLNAREIQDGLAMRFGDLDIDKARVPCLNSLVTVCFNLVTVHPGNQILSLAHFSIKEYLSEHMERWISEHQLVHLANPHVFLARKCIAYLSLEPFTGQPPKEFEDLEDRPLRYPLLGYAATFWGTHARRADPEATVHDATTLLASESQIMTAGLMMARYEKFASHYEHAYKGMRPLHVCAIFDLSHLVKQLILKGNDLNATTHGDWSALHWAARNGSEGVSTLLLSSGALTDIKTKVEGWTPLHLAAKENHPRIVASLLDWGADVNARDLQKRTPLYLACLSRCPEVVSVLLSHARKADCSISNAYGATPLHCAAKQGIISIVNELLSHSDIQSTDDLGLTPLDEAHRRGQQAVVEILLRAITREGDLKLNTLSLTAATTSGSSPADLRWNTYEVDEKKTALIQQGNQCTCHVLRKSNNTEPSPMMVFRKTFNLTSDVRGFVRYFSSERQILYRLRHPNIVSYLDFDEDPDQNSLILYLEYCDRGDLTQMHGLPHSLRVSSDNFPCEDDDGSSSGEDDIEFGFYSAEKLPLSQTTPLKGAETWSLIYQLSSALAYLHYGLSIKEENVGYTASFETSWEYILHRDIKPANVVMQSSEDGKYIAKVCDLGIASEAGRGGANQTQYIGSSGFHPPEVLSGNFWSTKGDIFCLGVTIKSSFKLKDTETASICSFIKTCIGRQTRRKSSLQIMEEAYSHLQRNDGLKTLPAPIAKQCEAFHSLLSVQPGGYILQAFKLVAELLDDVVPYERPEAKDSRKSTIKRLQLLLNDGAHRPFYAHPYEYSAHLYIVLGDISSLQSLLSSGADPNSKWKRSLLTPLHVAAQEEKQDMVQMLLNFGANKSMRDLHDLVPADYARATGHTGLIKLLEVPA